MRHIEPNHPHPEKGQIRVYEEGESIPDIRSSKQGSINDVTYFELENLLGEPTYPNQSADEKKFKKNGLLNLLHQVPFRKTLIYFVFTIGKLTLYGIRLMYFVHGR